MRVQAADGEKNAVVDLDAKWANAVNSVGSNLLQARLATPCHELTSCARRTALECAPAARAAANNLSSALTTGAGSAPRRSWDRQGSAHQHGSAVWLGGHARRPPARGPQVGARGGGTGADGQGVGACGRAAQGRLRRVPRRGQPQRGACPRRRGRGRRPGARHCVRRQREGRGSRRHCASGALRREARRASLRRPPPPQMGALRVAAYSAQGVRAVETNPAFEAEVLALTKDAVGVILACASGGTLKPTTNFPDGQASRSLLAAARLLQARGGASLREPRASAITRWPAARRRRAREVPPASCTCRAGWRRGSRAGCPARATRRRGTRRRGGCRRSKGRNTSRMLPS